MGEVKLGGMERIRAIIYIIIKSLQFKIIGS